MEKYEKNQELIEKIIGILGYDAYDAFIKSFFDSKRKMIDFKNDNERQIKNQVMQSNRLSLQQKALLNNVLCKNLNSFMKQLEILNIALDNMDENANGENLDDEWILDFFDKSTRIKSESTKIVWGKMLANAASDKRICSKILLNSLFLMGSEEISDFLNVCRFCFSEMSAGKNKEEISSYPVIFFNKKGEDYKKEKISILSLHKLQMLGLIETDFNNEYLFDKKNMRLIYEGAIVDVEADKKIRFGNVRFTYEGFILYDMTEKIFDENILKFTSKIWRKMNYNVSILQY